MQHISKLNINFILLIILSDVEFVNNFKCETTSSD